MSGSERDDDLDPAEVEPTDNSTGAAVDPERLDEVEHGGEQSPPDPAPRTG